MAFEAAKRLLEGDVTPPSAPLLTSTNPASPGSSATPLILGAAEAGSTVRGQTWSLGISVEVAEGVTAAFSATATDAADNTSACSALEAANCSVGKVHKPKRKKGKKLGPLVVKSSKPSAGETLKAGSEVNLKLGPKPRKARP